MEKDNLKLAVSSKKNRIVLISQDDYSFQEERSSTSENAAFPLLEGLCIWTGVILGFLALQIILYHRNTIFGKVLEKYEITYKKNQSFTVCCFLGYWLKMESMQRFLEILRYKGICTSESFSCSALLTS